LETHNVQVALKRQLLGGTRRYLPFMANLTEADWRRRQVWDLILLLIDQWHSFGPALVGANRILRIDANFVAMIDPTPVFMCPALGAQDTVPITGAKNTRLASAAAAVNWMARIQPLLIADAPTFIRELKAIIKEAVQMNFSCIEELVHYVGNPPAVPAAQPDTKNRLMMLCQAIQPGVAAPWPAPPAGANPPLPHLIGNFFVWLRRLLELLEKPDIMKPCIVGEDSAAHHDVTPELSTRAGVAPETAVQGLFLWWMLNAKVWTKVELIDFQFNELYSVDCCCFTMARREGTLVLKLKDRIATLGWRTDWCGNITGDAKFWKEEENPKHGYLLHYGPPDEAVIDIQVMESDQDSQTTTRSVGKLAQQLGLIGEMAPPPYNLAGTGLGVLGAGITYLSNFIDNDLEFKERDTIPKTMAGVFSWGRYRSIPIAPGAQPNMSVTIRKTGIVLPPPKLSDSRKVTVYINQIEIPSGWMPEIERSTTCGCPSDPCNSCRAWRSWNCNLWGCLMALCPGVGRLQPDVEITATFGNQIMDPIKVKTRNGDASLENTLGIGKIQVFSATQNVFAPTPFTIAIHNGLEPASSQEIADVENLLTKAGSLQKAIVNQIQTHKKEELAALQKEATDKQKKLTEKKAALVKPTLPPDPAPIAAPLPAVTPAVLAQYRRDLANYEAQIARWDTHYANQAAKLETIGEKLTDYNSFLSDPHRWKTENLVAAGLPIIKTVLYDFVPERKSFLNFSALLTVPPNEVPQAGRSSFKRFITFQKTGLTDGGPDLVENDPRNPLPANPIGVIELEIVIEDAEDPLPETTLKEINDTLKRLDEDLLITIPH